MDFEISQIPVIPLLDYTSSEEEEEEIILERKYWSVLQNDIYEMEKIPSNFTMKYNLK